MSDAQGVGGTAKFRKALSKAEMRHQIQRLNPINANVAEWKTIREIYRDLFPEVQLVIGTTKSSEQFFRARVNPPAKLHAVTELMAPPAEFVTGYQRCNPPGSPIFYCSTRRITALEECRVTAQIRHRIPPKRGYYRGHGADIQRDTRRIRHRPAKRAIAAPSERRGEGSHALFALA